MSAPVNGIKASDMVCATKGCSNPCVARGLCRGCYQRFRKSVGFTAIDRTPAKCAVEGCGGSGRLKRDWCSRHYQKWKKYGDPEHPRQPNEGRFKPRPATSEGLLKCSRCEEWRDTKSFYGLHDKWRSEGSRDSVCKQCNRMKVKEWRRMNPDAEQKQRHRSYAVRYGLTLEEYEEMFAVQDDRCGICGRISGIGKGRLHVDHDHDTGYVRGLLCGNCNRGLGMFQHDPKIMGVAINWLDRQTEGSEPA